MTNGTGDNDSEGGPASDVPVSDETGGPTSLQPFVHQVGGHSNMFTYEGNTICKPLFEKEYDFYQTMPEEMRPFTPICKGNLDVMFHKDASSQVHISIVSPVRPLRGENGIILKTDESDEEPEKEDRQPLADQTERSSAVISNSNFEKNPWSERCHKRMLDQMTCESEGPMKYIILENAVIGFKIPSILDLKMGTRQHGLDDNEFKTDLKICRCLSSTTCTLGFRVGGMQVYQKDTGEFLRYNKYSVETINRDTIHEPVYKFLYNGVRLRLELVDLIVEKLRAISLAVAKRNDIRMFSSSLMVMYESVENPSATDEDTALDCEKSWEGNLQIDSSDSVSQSPLSATSHSIANSSMNIASGLTNSKNKDVSDLKVDIKMIDFAHSFHTASRTDVKFVGPDAGYIFGLENLIKIFLNVKERNSES
ncbi:inositol hexakisphosphate kinase 1-like [Lineus longissimus]|uniref:inositol hexakisphosphate kinase 1-like n=1 Tax=Lineus longissimus TaxID=88925 RepID=UPI002B4E450D